MTNAPTSYSVTSLRIDVTASVTTSILALATAFSSVESSVTVAAAISVCSPIIHSFVGSPLPEWFAITGQLRYDRELNSRRLDSFDCVAFSCQPVTVAAALSVCSPIIHSFIGSPLPEWLAVTGQLRSDREFKKAWIRRELDKAMWLLWLSDNLEDDTICCIAFTSSFGKKCSSNNWIASWSRKNWTKRWWNWWKNTSNTQYLLDQN